MVGNGWEESIKAERTAIKGPGLPELPDEELVSLCLQNDRIAWNEFFDRFLIDIIGTIEHSLKEVGYVWSFDDVVRDIHMEVLDKLFVHGSLSQCRHPERLRKWVKKMASNQTLDWLR